MTNNDQTSVAFDDSEFDLMSDEQPTASPSNEIGQGLDFFHNIPVQLSLEVGSVDIPLSKLMTATKDTVIELDKFNGQPLDIKVNGKLFGYGEVVVTNNKYGLRITEILSPKPSQK